MNPHRLVGAREHYEALAVQARSQRAHMTIDAPMLYFIIRGDGRGTGGGWITPQLDLDKARAYARNVGGILCGVPLALFEDYL